MNIALASTALHAAGFNEPVLNALIPNEANYSVLLMQPLGRIEASAAGVRNRDHDLAHRQFSAFLKDAQQTQADLAVTPEYSMPWKTLVQALKAGVAPVAGKLWAIGCESIKYGELEGLKEDLAEVATVLFEPLQPDAARFTDPLAYIFLAPPAVGQGPARLVILIQFKTYPMGDQNHFEFNGLQRGTRIYQFGVAGQGLKLVSIICSDAFDFLDPDAAAVYDRALVLHIQLNPEPRHERSRLYRDRLLRFQGDQTELICLNWAKDVEEWCDEKSKAWNNISGSGWYLKPNKFDEQDTTLSANHRRGLYYTWLRPLFTHALFFNYKPATFFLHATKVAHIGVPAAISRRRGPQLSKTSVWNDAGTVWVEQVCADDGFAAVVAESGHAKDELRRVADANPIAVERILALCAGEIGHNQDWHSVRKLDSCAIDSSEVILRITFCQDTDSNADGFRVRRLRRCRNLWDILKTNGQLPPALFDLSQGFQFDWTAGYPHQNARSANGKRATLIYLGEDCNLRQVEAVFKYARVFIQREFADPNDSHNARQRLAVWYRGENGHTELFGRDEANNFSMPGDAPEFDIGRES